MIRIACPLLPRTEINLAWIEVSSSFQIPHLQIIGLPAPEVAEARERVRIAIEASGFEMPRRRVTLNLAPASLRKSGTALDLAMALAVLGHSKDLLSGACTDKTTSILALGELGLSGEIKPCAGLAATLAFALEGEFEHVFVPRATWKEVAQTLGVLARVRGCMPNSKSGHIHPVGTLEEAARILAQIEDGTVSTGALIPTLEQSAEVVPKLPESILPLAPAVARFVGCVAAGRHSALLLGSRGVGKSQMLEWIAALHGEPAPDAFEWHWLRETHTPALAPGQGIVRRVQPEISVAALVGSAQTAAGRAPLGELTLAHGGVLIANELLEWSRPLRECLREPLETHRVRLLSAHGRLELPADFQFLASANLCPCGGAEHLTLTCRCTPPERQRYLRKLSGPLLDRLGACWILSQRSAAPQTDIGVQWNELWRRVRTTQASLIQAWGNLPSRLDAAQLEHLIADLSGGQELLDAALPRGETSLRARHQLLRMGLTIQAWNDPKQPRAVSTIALAEALRYRCIPQWTTQA